MPSAQFLLLRTRSPVGEEGEKVGCADDTVNVKISEAASLPARAPAGQQPEQVGCANRAITVQIGKGDLVSWIEVLTVQA